MPINVNRWSECVFINTFITGLFYVRCLATVSGSQLVRFYYYYYHRGVDASDSCSGDRGNLFTVGTYCYVAVRRGRLGGARRFGAHRGRRRAGHIVAAPAHLVLGCYDIIIIFV